MRNVEIDYKKKIVTKQGLPDSTGMEAKMTRKAYELSRNCKTFRVPQVISYDSFTGELELELIENIKPIYTLLPGSNDMLKKIVSTAGECLALVHSELSFEKKDIIRIPGELDIDDDGKNDVFFHGDFNLSNVQYDFRDNSLVILDWSLTPLFGVSANYGPRYWDIAWMVNALFAFRPYKFFSRCNERRVLADIFLKSYFKSSKCEIDSELLSQYMHRVYLIFLKKAKQRLKWHKYLLQKNNRKQYGDYAKSLTVAMKNLNGNGN